MEIADKSSRDNNARFIGKDRLGLRLLESLVNPRKSIRYHDRSGLLKKSWRSRCFFARTLNACPLHCVP
jgi:hypothetical protein